MPKHQPITATQTWIVPRMPRLFPPKKRVNLRYAWSTLTTKIDAVTGDFTMFNFAGNGCYDPDITGVGNQPRGFDEAMNIYGSYRVIGSKICVRVQADAQMVDTYIGLYPQSSSAGIAGNRFPFIGVTGTTAYATVGRAALLPEQPGMMVGMMGFVTENNTLLLERKVLTNSVINHKAADKSSFYGDASKNPTSVWYWSIIIGNAAGAAQSDIATMSVTIDYDVEFSESIALVDS